MNSKSLHKRMELIYIEGICALDVSEALLSVDTMAIEQGAELPDVKVIGVRQAGRVTGFVTLALEVQNIVTPISSEQVLPDTAGLSEVILTLNNFSCCFVEVLGEIIGIITREDMEKPPARMWLFGILTIIEPFCSRKLEELFPSQSWTQHVPAARLEKAKSLQAERERRNIQTSLVDCLQFSDKLQVLLRAPEMLNDFGVISRREGLRLTKALESLRNNLAHNQPITESNWDSIVLAARRLERILTRL
jgi:hypothetical protein